MPGRQQPGERGSSRDIPALEWGAAVLGLVLIVGSIAGLLYGAFEQDTPPNLRAESGRIIPVSGRYLVQVKVRNHGGTTAASVLLEGKLQRDAKTIEVAAALFDYVPAHSMTEGGLFFTHDPRAYELRLETKSYEKP